MKRVLSALYRVRGPICYAAAAVLIGNVVVGRLVSSDALGEVRAVAVIVALVLAVICLLLAYLMPRWLPVREVVVVEPPVKGRWLGLNSPASAVPSHGVRMYGQAYAIDIVHDPLDAARPVFGDVMMRPESEYPAFGQPVFAMIDGTVVRASGWRRDHRARSNWWGFLYMMVEGMIREIGGPGFVVGNHVTIRGDDGVYATVAHLQQRSVTVAVGDRVGAGERIGRCGNSGNASEPHVHAQLMDRGSLWIAQGIPMAFAGIALGEHPERVDSLPENEQHMTVIAGDSA